MPLREASPLLAPLVLSLTLHVGGVALMDAHYGAAPGFALHQPGLRQATPLRVTYLDARLASAADNPGRPGANAETAQHSGLPEGIFALPGPYYFQPRELSRKPQITSPVMLDYPDSAPLVIKNQMVLRLLISETGNVDKVIVDTANVPEELEMLARQAFALAKFKPGLRGETPVKSQMQVEITFEGGDVPPPPGATPPPR